MAGIPNRRMRRDMMKRTGLEQRSDDILKRQYQQRVHKAQVEIQKKYATLIEKHIAPWRLSLADWLAKYPIRALFAVLRRPRGTLRRVAWESKGANILWLLPSYAVFALLSTIIDWVTLSPVMMIGMSLRTHGIKTEQKFLSSRQIEFTVRVWKNKEWVEIAKEGFEV